MKKLVLCLAVMMSVMSCSDDDSTTVNEPIVIDDIVFEEEPVSGKLFGENFNVDGGRVTVGNFQGINSFVVLLTEEGYGCEVDATIGFPIRFAAPAVLGVHTSNVSASFNRPNSDDHVLVDRGIRVEFTEITIERAKGKVIVVAPNGNSINGTFDLPICQ